MYSVCAVIVNYHQPLLTRQAVDSVLASCGVQVRVILVDNESDGALRKSLPRDDDRIVLLENTGNMGFGAACNQGMEYALGFGCDCVLLLNNDAIVAPEAIRQLAAAAGGHGLAAPKILLPDGRIYSAGGIVEIAKARCRNRGIYEEDRGQYDQPELMRFASACALMVSRRALETGARFHAPFFLYYEDADFCLQMQEAGFRVAYTPSARVTHLESATTSSERGLGLLYYDARNRFLFLRRHGKWFEKCMGALWLVSVTKIRILSHLMRGRAREALVLFTGLIHGLLGRTGQWRG